MAYSYVLNVEEEIEKLKQDLCDAKKELLDCPGGSLGVKSFGDGNHLYVHRNRVGQAYTKSGISKNQEMIAKLCRKAYLEKQIVFLEKCILSLKKIRREFSSPSPNNIMNSLPHKYADLPPAFFLRSIDEIKEAAGEVTFRGGNAWAHMEYEQDDKYPEGKVIPVMGNLYVRSKSEALIARELMRHGVAFHYEEVVHIPNSRAYYVPDFTIRRDDGKVFYWEHFGLTNDENYLQGHARKLVAYEGLGITPWDNFIATYDHDGVIDIREVEFIIENRLKK